jgi:hypothetical protein
MSGAVDSEVGRLAGGRLAIYGLFLNVPLAISLLWRCGRGLLDPASLAASDFTVFWSAWWLILHGRGRALYDEAAQRAAQHLLMGGHPFEGGLMAFLNPPHAALAGVPLGWLADHAGERAAFAIWAAVNLALLVRLDVRLRGLLGAGGGRARAVVTVALCAFYPVLYTISVGQLSLLLAVAALELPRCLEARRPRAAAGWLLALSVKPQLLAPVLVLLAARRRWAVLAHAAALGAAVAAVTALVLGPRIWLDYVRSVGGLERFFGTGTPDYMMNLRGAITRLAGGAASPDSVYVAAAAAWLAALAALAMALVRRTARAADARADLALTLAVGLLFCPHLFVQDAVLWVGALALHVAALRACGARWMPFAAFALAWPLVFAISRAVDLGGGGGPLLRVDPVVVVMVAALLAMVRAPSGRLVHSRMTS